MEGTAVVNHFLEIAGAAAAVLGSVLFVWELRSLIVYKRSTTIEQRRLSADMMGGLVTMSAFFRARRRNRPQRIAATPHRRVG